MTENYTSVLDEFYELKQIQSKHQEVVIKLVTLLDARQRTLEKYVEPSLPSPVLEKLNSTTTEERTLKRARSSPE